MKKKGWIFFFCFASLLSGCAPIHVRIDFDPVFDFSTLRSYQFVSRQQGSATISRASSFIRDPFFLKELEKEIGAVLIKKGFQMAPTPRNADFLVSYYAVAQNRTTIAPTSYRTRRYPGRVVSPRRVYRYRQGTLVIDIVDTGQRELVWRGVGSGVLDRINPARNLLAAVEKVLRTFPPR